MTNTSEVNHQSERLPNSENIDYRVSTEDFSVEFSVSSVRYRMSSLVMEFPLICPIAAALPA